MEIHDSRKEKKEQQKPLIQNVGFKKPPSLKIHDSRNTNKFERPTFKLILFYQRNRKKIKWVILFIFILLIIIFPVWSGSMIGTWIKDFFGTIIHIVKTI